MGSNCTSVLCDTVFAMEPVQHSAMIKVTIYIFTVILKVHPYCDEMLFEVASFVVIFIVENALKSSGYNRYST